MACAHCFAGERHAQCFDWQGLCYSLSALCGHALLCLQSPQLAIRLCLGRCNNLYDVAPTI
eukprot:1351385-Alexandrium_andersonii.AAC.1